MKVIVGLVAGTVGFAIPVNDEVAAGSLQELERANREAPDPMDSIRAYEAQTTFSVVNAITKEG